MGHYGVVLEDAAALAVNLTLEDFGMVPVFYDGGAGS